MDERRLKAVLIVAFVIWLLSMTICSLRVFHLENRVEYLEWKLEEFIQKY